LLAGFIVVLTAVFAALWIASPALLAPALEAIAQLGAVQSAVIFVVTYIVAAALILPASAALSIAAGFRFGFLPGLCLSGLANLLAVALQWAIGARFPSRVDRLVHRFPALSRLDEWSRERTVRVIVLLRLSSFVPFAALNYAAPARRLDARRYALGTLVGLAPSELALVYAGSAASDLTEAPDPLSKFFLGAGIGATLCLLVWGGRVAMSGLAAEASID
jgi:uncharacterized membrane protein YdjX (TVP38/TMEM64 family)